MHATLELAQSIVRVLQYHELKVQKGRAELIGGENFIKEPQQLNYDEKLFHYNRLITLNENGYKPVLHVFMRFNRVDTIDSFGMQRVAQAYMEDMGYGGQPWLAYRHRDTLHPHLHLVSTTIRADGTRIPLTLALLEHSRELTHQLEKQFDLDQGDEEATLRAQHTYLQKVEYGKTSLYPAIKLVLETIVPAYRYTNLNELNAVLGLFNVKASRGKEQSVTYQKHGLLYYPLLADGREGPAYIKASAFPSKPTLDRLEQRFAENLQVREAHRRRLTSTIDYALAGSTLSFGAFTQEMGRQNVSVVMPRSSDTFERMWYVDHRTQTVFEGTALGVRYSGAALGERCLPEETYQQKQQLQAQEEAERQSHRMRHSL
jgi:Relaxase/Mobilisation nuclease domain